ncbi:Poxvirus A32 protein [Popillia japonica]|uniref:Poxvirus A32 protein n=1 Tax=Popillia japonica TaxID=7064 RepID=A0AAW1JS73_POPJA
MRLLKQKHRLQVLNVDVDDDKHRCRHGNILPDTIRCIICGPSNCGKTNVMLALLIDENGLRFDNLYVYSRSLYQPKYQFLEKVMKSSGIKYYAYNENEEVVDPVEAEKNSVFIFDDVVCDKQDKIRLYFCMGRHKAVDSFYLCQTYSRIPKQLVRDNTNLLILFKQDEMNLKHIFDDHVGTDMSFHQFKSMCAECWKDKYGFLVIDRDRDIDKGRYKKNFDWYICL